MTAPAGEVRGELLACNASTHWAATVLAGRPYPDPAALDAASDAAVAALAWPDVLEALAAHPRIGERATERATEHAWSRGEQSGVVGAEDEVLAGLAAGNAEYEQRFGYVYLVCAAGRPAAELLRILRDRLGNDPEPERDVVRRELAAITRLRLAKLVAPADEGVSPR
jgi:2-oxo-4-hydroxy-4-carboxy-5-ureidoimidazoline decarboxylase